MFRLLNCEIEHNSIDLNKSKLANFRVEKFYQNFSLLFKGLGWLNHIFNILVLSTKF